ncbi:MAG: DNA oxidative demethylase AlkB [Planctomycetes bacterium]|nr:DNA oxidative demethylase AlkB [Planctomycetota bacterium]
MQRGLFDDLPYDATARRRLAPGAFWLVGFARGLEAELHHAVAAVAAMAPFRAMATPGGRPMSVTTTCCGAVGWVSDRHGYRYAPCDPTTGAPWPPMPPVFADLAARAAAAAGHGAFAPDACLVNRYAPGARMGLHQDVDERDFAQPIVSVSLGLPAVFRFGGVQRGDAARRVPLASGDVVVWGGPSRRFFHGVLPVADGLHPRFGRCRINLTFRVAR